jgi:monoterpene epsilon-lactone hydrolase
MMSTTPRFPAPAHLSEHARAVLTAPAPDAAYPAHEDDQGWKDLVVRSDEMIRTIISGMQVAVSSDRREIAGVPTYILKSDDLVEDDTTTVNLDIHGGALISGGGDLVPAVGSLGATGSGMVHWAVDYRMPPEHPFPAGLDDVVAVYRALVEVKDPSRVVVSGASAGGNLAAALMLRIKDEGLPMPAALVLNAPELDLTESGDSFVTLAEASNTLQSLMKVNLKYADGVDLEDPYISPLFGDVTGFPPTLLTAGTRDIFLSNSVRMHRKLRSAGVEAELHVFEAMPHGGFAGAPEDLELQLELRRFYLRKRLV